jgi:uncharacterized cupredoxin-like copper-binding protein
MRLGRLALVPVAALAIAACTPARPSVVPPTFTPALPTAAATAAPSALPPTPPATASPTAAPSAAPLATRIEVTLSDTMRIEPLEMTVPTGVPVTFVVTNAGVIEHEFFLGDEAAQAEHDKEMLAGGMAHDEPTGIAVEPGETKELTITFPDAGSILAGCHVPGHYAAGMKASVEIGS